MFFGNKIVFWKKNFFFEKKCFLGFFFWHCPALPAAMFGRHCQPPFLVRHCYLRRFNMREGGRTVGTGIVTQGQCVVDLWTTKKKQKSTLTPPFPVLRLSHFNTLPNTETALATSNMLETYRCWVSLFKLRCNESCRLGPDAKLEYF